MGTFTKILLYISYFSVLIPLLFFFKREKNQTLEILNPIGLLLFIAAFSDGLGYFLIMKEGRSNIIIDNIYAILQFSLLSYIYTKLLNNKKLMYICFLIVIITFILDSLFFEPIAQLQNWLLVVENCFLVFYATLCYFQLYYNPGKEEHINTLALWINAAVLFYFGLNLYLFITIDYVFKNESIEIAILSWSFHNLFNIGKNIIFATGIYYSGIKTIKT